MVPARYTRHVAPTRAPSRTVRYRDSEGRPTSDPAEAVSGDVIELDVQGRRAHRTRFFLQREQLPWLPVTEPAFLLWVLAALVAVWVGIAAYLGLT
jgi:hypothetical protein